MSQGNLCFWDFAISLQLKNALLTGIMLHLPKDKLHHQLEVNIEKHLAARCHHKKSNQIIDFQKWLLEVQCIDNLLIGDHKEVKAMKANRESTCHVATLSEPSHHANAANQNTSSSTSAPHHYVPKLTNLEKKLLTKNEGCFKCCHFFIKHQSKECLDEFPNPTTYKTLTTHDVEIAKCNHKLVLLAKCTSCTKKFCQTGNCQHNSRGSLAKPGKTILGGANFAVKGAVSRSQIIISEFSLTTKYNPQLFLDKSGGVGCLFPFEVLNHIIFSLWLLTGDMCNLFRLVGDNNNEPPQFVFLYASTFLFSLQYDIGRQKPSHSFAKFCQTGICWFCLAIGKTHPK